MVNGRKLCIACGSTSCSHLEPFPAILFQQELLIVELAANGSTNKTIAFRLGISEAAVKSAIHRIYRKLGISEKEGSPRVNLSLWARRHSEALHPHQKAA